MGKQVPFYYRPWPHQVAAWKRRRSGKYTFYIKLWCRQSGKDTDDIQYCLNDSWRTPGIQTAYVGLNNVWINNNIFKKYIDGRTHWMDYPETDIDVKETQKEVFFKNNPRDLAQSRIKYIGFMNDESIIGSSYDRFYISETSLYRRDAFQYVWPIWERKIALGVPLTVNFNGTPRGMRNVYYDLLVQLTGCEDPADFPGEHGDTYVDFVRSQDLLIPDGNGGYKPMYTQEMIEREQARHMRAYGNLNVWHQESDCDFFTVNAGLVYKAIEQLEKDGRYTRFNLDTSRPVYMAWDISSKGKMTDASSCIVYQMIDGRFMIYDVFEARGLSLVECVAELSKKPYFHYIRFGALPWDSDRSASSETPLEEVRRVYPNINWHALDQERVDRGIQLVRNFMPNMWINSENCEYLLECFNNYEYKRLEKAEDWSPKPVHNRYSHLMDALRYAAMAVKEIEYLRLNAYGADPDRSGYYGGYTEEDYEPPSAIWMTEKERREARNGGPWQRYGI